MRDEGGQALAEFALVLPVLLGLVTVMLSAGNIYRNYLSLTDAVRNGARVAVVSRTAADPTGTAVAAVVNAGSDLNLTSSNVQVTTSPAWQAGADVTVTATYPYTLDLFGIPVTSGTISSSTTVRVE